MNAENICFASKTIDIAEHDTYLELTNCMGYFDDENLNHVILPYEGCEEEALAMAQTLINMPVQAKYKKVAGHDDLGSHECVMSPDGEIEFLTESVGVNTDVWIEKSNITTVNGETKELPCLFAKKRIWKRNKNMVNAIKRLYESTKGLGSSWEIQTYEYSYKDGKKTLNNYTFLADTLLGSTVTPAYSGTSKAFALSEQDLMVAEALGLDMCDSEAFDINNNEDRRINLLEEKNKDLVNSSEETEVVETEVTSETEQTPTAEVVENPVAETETPVEETSETEEDEKEKENPSDEEPTDPEEDDKEKEEETSETETSALTSYDLMRKLSKALYEVDDNLWISYMFPEEHKIWTKSWKMGELEYLEFDYSVEGDIVKLGEGVEITIVASPKNINNVVAELNQQIESKDDIIAKSSETITNLKAEIAELNVFKTKFEEVEQAKIDAEIAAQKEELIASVCKSGMITKEEIAESAELSAMVEQLDKKSLMSIVGERLLSSIEQKPEVEVSETKETVRVATNLNNDDEETVSMKDKVASLRKSLRK